MQHLELIAMAKKFKILSLGPLVSCVESLSAINSVKDASREAIQQHENNFFWAIFWVNFATGSVLPIS